MLENVLNKDWSKIISTCNLIHWKEALATIMTYTNDNESNTLCDLLGSRLEEAGQNDDTNLLNACICYICSSNLDNLISCWQKLNDRNIDQLNNPSASLQVINYLISYFICE